MYILMYRYVYISFKNYKLAFIEDTTMQKIPITEARNKFMKLPDQTAKDQIIAVTRRNKEVMAVMSWELYEGLLETLEVLSDPELIKQLRSAIEDVKAGRTHSLSDAHERLRL
jgi:antitoxin YefM